MRLCLCASLPWLRLSSWLGRALLLLPDTRAWVVRKTVSQKRRVLPGFGSQWLFSDPVGLRGCLHCPLRSPQALFTFHVVAEQSRSRTATRPVLHRTREENSMHKFPATHQHTHTRTTPQHETAQHDQQHNTQNTTKQNKTQHHNTPTHARARMPSLRRRPSTGTPDGQASCKPLDQAQLAESTNDTRDRRCLPVDLRPSQAVFAVACRAPGSRLPRECCPTQNSIFLSCGAL